MRKKKNLLLIGVFVLCICTCVVLMIVAFGKKSNEEAGMATDQPTQESEVFELDMVPWVPIDTDALFNDTYWCWVVGPTVGSVLAAQFHLDGTVEYCRTTSHDYVVTSYECDGQLLTIEGIAYWWDGTCFQSTVKHDAPMEPEGTYYVLTPDDEQVWRPYLYEVQEARQNLYEEYQQAQEITKKLVRVTRHEGTQIWEYEFLYDENDLLTQVTETRNADQDPYAVTTFSYNEGHQLTDRKVTYDDDGNTRNTSATYRYDTNGKLVSSVYLSAEGGGCNIIYEYDLREHPLKITTDYNISRTIHCFRYDGNGQMCQYSSVWMNEETPEMTSVLVDSSSCGFTYQYRPFLTYTDGRMFLLDEYGNGNALEMDTGTVLYGFAFQNLWCICDEDGYVTKVVDDSAIYDFYYE